MRHVCDPCSLRAFNRISLVNVLTLIPFTELMELHLDNWKKESEIL